MNICVKLGFSLVIALAPLALVSCSEAVDEATDTIKCNQVCERYADCFKSDYDVEGCTDKCENSADDDAERERKLEKCNNCIDDRSCTEASFNCAADCVGIVP